MEVELNRVKGIRVGDKHLTDHTNIVIKTRVSKKKLIGLLINMIIVLNLQVIVRAKHIDNVATLVILRVLRDEEDTNKGHFRDMMTR